MGHLCRPADDRTAVLHPAGQLAPSCPYHRGRDLRADNRREGLFRHPRRVRFGKRSEDCPPAPAGDHGPGWLQRPDADQHQGSGADAALLAEPSGSDLHVLRRQPAARLSVATGNRAARSGRQFPGHDVLAALLSRWPEGHHEPAAGRQCQYLYYGPALANDDAPDLDGRNRYGTFLFAGWSENHFRKRPWRPSADLCDECRWFGTEPYFLR
ncbi:hypothetical protein D3C73_1141520 [compost metagenome]